MLKTIIGFIAITGIPIATYIAFVNWGMIPTLIIGLLSFYILIKEAM